MSKLGAALGICQRERLNPTLTWTLEIPCWILDILHHSVKPKQMPWLALIINA